MRLILTFVAALVWTTSALAAPPPGFEQRVEALRRQIGVPGMAVAIVEKGRVTHARGYGVKRLGGSDAVDADTIFPSGSTGKAFTVADLALLVDEGKLGWDDRVVDHMPGFQMYDPWVTREMTVRDLLVHRSGLGLGAGDLLFVPRSNLSRAETVRRLRHIKPATSFRSGYAYDNILYMAAGQLIEAVSGQTWEAFTRDRLLRPAGMHGVTVEDEHRWAAPNRALPHARLNGGLRGAGDQEPLDERGDASRNSAPAGGLAVSANDMTRWLRIQLAQGRLPEGGRLFSEAVHREMWTPVVLQPITPHPAELKPLEPMFYTYALGWDVQDYRGARLIWHGGAVSGFLAAVALLPDQDVGFAILINSEDGEIIRGLMAELLDHYLGLPRQDWTGRYAAYKRGRIAEALKTLKADAARPAKSGPSLPLPRYAGVYADPWYGQVAVAAKDGGLAIDFRTNPGMTGRLEHWQYDTFVTRFDDRTIEPAYVTFSLDAEGKVERVRMKAVSPLADFSFDYHDLDLRPSDVRP